MATKPKLTLKYASSNIYICHFQFEGALVVYTQYQADTESLILRDRGMSRARFICASYFWYSWKINMVFKV